MLTENEQLSRDGSSARTALLRFIGMVGVLAVLWSAGLNRTVIAVSFVAALLALRDVAAAWHREREG